MSNSFDKPQTLPVHNSDAEPFFRKPWSIYRAGIRKDLAMLTESEKENLRT